MGRSHWVSDFERDIQQNTPIGGRSTLFRVARCPGLWALLQYRIAHQYRRYTLLRPGLGVWRLLVEMATGFSIPSEATIGPGLHISHPAGIVISPRAVIGADCHITHGVTIGVSGYGPNRGVPTIGDRVYIGPHAVVVGPIVVGDDAMIGANCVVSADVPARARVRPAPVSVFKDET